MNERTEKTCTVVIYFLKTFSVNLLYQRVVRTKQILALYLPASRYVPSLEKQLPLCPTENTCWHTAQLRLLVTSCSQIAWCDNRTPSAQPFSQKSRIILSSPYSTIMILLLLSLVESYNSHGQLQLVSYKADVCNTLAGSKVKKRMESKQIRSLLIIKILLLSL